MSFDYPARFWIATGLAGLGNIISASTGIGGGGLNVPIFVLVGGQEPSLAVPLSQCMIFGLAFASVFINYPKRHPLANRPLIDWNLVLCLEPTVLLGSVIGVVFNKILPGWMVAVLLSIVLSVSFWKTLKKFIAVYKDEKERIKNGTLVKVTRDITIAELNSGTIHEDVEMAEQSSSEDEEEPIEMEVLEKEMSPKKKAAKDKKAALKRTRELRKGVTTKNIDIDAVEDKDLQALLRKDARFLPYEKIIFLCCITLVLVFVAFLRGGEDGLNLLGIAACSWQWWLLTASLIPILMALSFVAQWMLIREVKKRKACGYPLVEGDIDWGYRMTMSVAGVGVGMGLCAGLLGIGGGMIVAPIMLELGVLPRVVSVTTVTMVPFTAVATVAQFFFLGILDPVVIVILAVVAFFCAMIGLLGREFLISKFNRQSFVSFALCFVVGLSLILLMIVAVLQLTNDILEGNNLFFKQPC
eukprot:TRINITY_DN1509_c1_g1_i1.p1 TRINITY_DN1509_c1_g1~~TRINITY_DN1509_c1_g1_i1.p1  ORF type:complete len:470 (+),score=120.74 TRINITY_DN1509_c1_g1_i1:210-1619(+)